MEDELSSLNTVLLTMKDEFTGYSCLLVTWKTNPEVEQFKVLK
jgi:hypothetical protein